MSLSKVSRAAWCLAIVALLGCNQSKVQPKQSSQEAPNPAAPQFEFQALDSHGEDDQDHDESGGSGIRLVEQQAELGLQHTYENGAQGRSLFVETIGGGGAWLDFDLDGWPDVFLNQGGDPTASDTRDQPSDQMFRNFQGKQFRALRSEDHFIQETSYSQGVGIGDFNEDGFPDIYVTNVGQNTLWVNCGDGTFVEAAEQAGLADPLWSVSVAWADVDQDGDLDLYVTNYCEYDARQPRPCLDRAGQDTLCNPAELLPQPDHFYANNGDGTFSEMSQELGISAEDSRALGVVIADFTGDQRPDIYVANDTTDNFLYVQLEDGTFSEQAKLRGCAVDRSGAPQGSMGLAVADYDRNGWLDIYSTHFFEESNTLYANQGERGFQDRTALVGLHRPTLPYLGFGTVFCDLDLDGLLELVVANGHVDNSARVTHPRMRAQLFTCDPSNKWTEVIDAGTYFEKQWLGRGVADADYDRDGDVDLLMIHENAPVALLANESEREGTLGLRLRFVGRESNRSGIGCCASVTYAGQTQYQQLVGGSSFAVSREPVLSFGFQKLSDVATDQAQVEVVWPSGVVQAFNATWDQELVVREPLQD